MAATQPRRHNPQGRGLRSASGLSRTEDSIAGFSGIVHPCVFPADEGDGWVCAFFPRPASTRLPSLGYRSYLTEDAALRYGVLTAQTQESHAVVAECGVSAMMMITEKWARRVTALVFA